MDNPNRERFVFSVVILLLSVYSGMLTLGLYQVKGKAEKLSQDQHAMLDATNAKIDQVMQYLENNQAANDMKDVERLKILAAEHEQKLFLLQNTIQQLYTLSD
jgi:hypothetical protein